MMHFQTATPATLSTCPWHRCRWHHGHVHNVRGWAVPDQDLVGVDGAGPIPRCRATGACRQVYLLADRRKARYFHRHPGRHCQRTSGRQEGLTDRPHNHGVVAIGAVAPQPHAGRWGNKQMKWIQAIVALIVLTANADDEAGKAMEYHYEGSNCYFVIAATQSRAFLDIRTYDNDKVVQSVVLSSRYMPAYFEARDVAADDGMEFLVWTRDGGTGIAETHLKIYGVIEDNIRKMGDFVVDHHSESWPEPTEEQTIKGEVTFPARDQLVYNYTRVITHDGSTVTNVVSETYAFNSRVNKFKRTTSPNKVPENTARKLADPRH